jgi:hypothetical protein
VTSCLFITIIIRVSRCISTVYEPHFADYISQLSSNFHFWKMQPSNNLCFVIRIRRTKEICDVFLESAARNSMSNNLKSHINSYVATNWRSRSVKFKVKIKFSYVVLLIVKYYNCLECQMTEHLQ